MSVVPEISVMAGQMVQRLYLVVPTVKHNKYIIKTEYCRYDVSLSCHNFSFYSFNNRQENSTLDMKPYTACPHLENI
jgi:hypothetical protein